MSRQNSYLFKWNYCITLAIESCCAQCVFANKNNLYLKVGWQEIGQMFSFRCEESWEKNAKNEKEKESVHHLR